MRALIVLPFLVSTASAGNTELSLGSSIRALRSPSADALTGDSLFGGSARLARELPLALPDHLALWAQAGVDWGSATGQMFQTLDTQIGSVALSGGARLRYTPLHYLAASALFSVGAERASVRLEDSAGHSASDHGWGGVARGALAVDLLAVDTPGFALGVRFELGYVAASGIELVPQRAHPADTLQLPMMEASLGSLDLGGPNFGIAVMSQF